MKDIKNIIFDFGGVFLEINYHLSRKAFEQLGVADFDEMYSQANADRLFQNLETGHISPEEFYVQFNRTTRLELPDAEIDKAWNAMLLHYRVSSVDFLETLKPRYKLYLFSNTNYIHMKAFRELFNKTHPGKNFDDYFDKAYYSCAMGLRKPDLESFEFIINELKIDPKETLFVDDSPQNIEAAESAGLKTIYLKPGMVVEDLDL